MVERTVVARLLDPQPDALVGVVSTANGHAAANPYTAVDGNGQRHVKRNPEPDRPGNVDSHEDADRDAHVDTEPHGGGGSNGNENDNAPSRASQMTPRRPEGRR